MIRLEEAMMEEAEAIAAMRTAVSDGLTSRHGQGPWSHPTTEKGMLFEMRNSVVYVAREGGKPIATLGLTTKKPWAIDRRFFTACKRPLYLVGMAVAPEHQRKGIGRACMEEAVRIAKAWPSNAIWLDAYNAKAGAGEFYRKCGFREVGRSEYRGVPLIYFEMGW